MKKIFKIIKRLLASFLMIYGYNVIASSIGFVIPINLITLLSITIFGLPALLSLIFLVIIVF